jgi:hypothetical protein
MNMKRAKIILFLAVLAGCEPQLEDNGRAEFAYAIETIGFKIEKMKCTGELTRYVNSGEKLKEKLLAADPRSFEFHCKIRAMDIKISKDSYWVWMVTGYRAPGTPNYSIVKIKDGVIYLKDAAIGPNDQINSIDWANVKYVLAKIKLDNRCGLSDNSLEAHPKKFVK